MQDIAVQYFTCDVSEATETASAATTWLEAMHEQQKAAFMRPDMNRCLSDPWFTEFFPDFVDSKTQNNSIKPDKDLLLKFPRKFSFQRPLVDPQVTLSTVFKIT